MVGYEGWYEVSNHGRVRSLPREVIYTDGRRARRRGKLISAGPNHSGHLQLRLYRGGDKRTIRVHVLVLEAFVGPRTEGMVACHNDGNPSNNLVANLRWDTMAANMADKKRHGTCYQLNKTHCIRGHEYSPENTNIHKTTRARLCKTCQQDQSRRAYAKKLARLSGVESRGAAA